MTSASRIISEIRKIVCYGFACTWISFVWANPNVDVCKNSFGKVPSGNPSRNLTLAEDRVSKNILQLMDGYDAVFSENILVKYWDPHLRSMVYHTASEPLEDGTIPLFDPKADSILVYVHGSGTEKSSGRNFIHNAIFLGSRGLPVVAMDLPYHGQSKASSTQEKLDLYMDQLHELIRPIKKAGKKVVFFGHSFGPEVILEFATRYPNEVDEVVLASPVPMQSQAHKWTYDNVTIPGDRYFEGGPVVPNEAGGNWAAKFGEQTSWFKKRLAPHIKVKILVGTLDEFWPPLLGESTLPAKTTIIRPKNRANILGNIGIAEKLGVKNPYTFAEGLNWLLERFPKVEVILLDGVGHMIFEALNRDGKGVINELLLNSAGIKGTQRDVKQPLSSRTEVAILAKHNLSFLDWLGAENLPKVISNEKQAASVVQQWNVAQFKIWKDLLENLESTHPNYFRNRRFLIARELKKVPKSIKDFKRDGWQPDAFRADFRKYIEGKGLGGDPAFPVIPEIDNKYVGEGRIPSSTNLPIRFEDFSDWADRSDIEFTSERVTENLVRLKFNQGDKPKEVYLTQGLGIDDLKQVVARAHLDAWAKNGYLAPNSKWVGEDSGFKVVATTDFNTKLQRHTFINISILPAGINP